LILTSISKRIGCRQWTVSCWQTTADSTRTTQTAEIPTFWTFQKKIMVGVPKICSGPWTVDCWKKTNKQFFIFFTYNSNFFNFFIKV